MILKLLTLIYAWVWGIQPWKPSGSEDVIILLVVGIPIDALVLGKSIHAIVTFVIARMTRRAFGHVR